MKILLIKPSWFENGLYKNCQLARVPPLNLGILAALLGDHYVKIADEDVEQIPYDEEWDLIGITTVTSTSLKTYKISEKFRLLKIKIILGGVHASCMPEEALKHADSVLIGEAEGLWPKVLSDFPNIKEKYVAKNPVALDALPNPRRDLFHPSYITAPLQITRGCMNSCKYCYLQNVSWKEYRKRPIDLVE